MCESEIILIFQKIDPWETHTTLKETYSITHSTRNHHDIFIAPGLGDGRWTNSPTDIMWYHVKDSKTTMHKSECHPNTVRINVGIIYIDNYNGQEGVFVSGGTNQNGQSFDCLEFFELESEVN